MQDTKSGENLKPGMNAQVAVTASRVMSAMDKKASADGSLRNEYARADALDIDTKALATAIKILKADDKDEQIQRLNNIIAYCEALDINISAQIDLFGNKNDGPLEDRAYENGLACGRMGMNSDHNPHVENTKAGQRWIEGWNTGGAERSAIMKMKVEVEVKKPGRPKKQQDATDDKQTDIEKAAKEKAESDGDKDKDPAPATSDDDWDKAAPKKPNAKRPPAIKK